MPTNHDDSSRSAQGIRRWWREPRRASDRIEDRKVSFLELFYDLVFVVLVSQVAHRLASHASLEGWLESAYLFAWVWLTWVNGTLYHELHGNHDVRTRVFTFLHMAAVAGMAVFAHDAFGEGATGFAWSVAAFQLLSTYLWWRTGRYDPSHRPISQPYAVSFLISGLLFAGSTALAEFRAELWSVALAASLVLPVMAMLRPDGDLVGGAAGERRLVATASLLERFGLFTIIVLGEVVVGVVNGATEAEWAGHELPVAAGLGLGVAFGLWWLYFDLVAHHAPRPGAAARAWM